MNPIVNFRFKKLILLDNWLADLSPKKRCNWM